ncbi:MAG: sulfite exporter TauE/SafE family protein [Bacteroidaceae bacterium]|nr:sulfite exporter TauE/SafE family protein [Bacteroidaceae bacterium]
MMTTLLLILTLAMCASLIQRVSGFGFGIFVMMFFPYILPSYSVSTTLSGVLAGTTALIIAIQGWRHIQWRLMMPLLAVNIAVSFIAIEYMSSLADGTIKKCFGAMFIAIAIYFLLRGNKAHVPQTWWIKGGLGALSGVMGGMFAMPGPPLVLYCISHINDKKEYIATLQAFSVILNIFYTIFRAKVGFFDDEMPLWWCAGVSGALIGTAIGKRIMERINGEVLKRIIYAMLLISGTAAMV